MASRADFTQEEWDVLATAPDAASLAILAVYPDSAVKEREAMFDAWRASSDQLFADNQLVLTLIRNRDAAGEAMRFMASPEESLTDLSADAARTRALELCQKAMTVLERKASPQDQANYARWIMFLAEAVAGAVKSGSLQDRAEQAVLRDLAAALRLSR